MKFEGETTAAILGAAVRALDAEHKEVTEQSLYEATKSKGIDRGDVRDFLEKAKRGKTRGQYPGYTPKNPL